MNSGRVSSRLRRASVKFGGCTKFEPLTRRRSHLKRAKEEAKLAAAVEARLARKREKQAS